MTVSKQSNRKDTIEQTLDKLSIHILYGQECLLNDNNKQRTTQFETQDMFQEA